MIANLDPSARGTDMVYDDIFCGSDYLDMAQRIGITEDDFVITQSMDGAQVYQNKKSDTWIGIWIINDYSPHIRVNDRHTLSAFIIPGPNKPKIIDSFTFRGLHHFSALQRENNGKGLRVWDALKDTVVDSKVIHLFATADAVGMPELDGRVGHHGARACRLGCPMVGRHKPNSGHYFQAHARPYNNPVQDCDHPSVNVRLLSPLSPEQYREDLDLVISSRTQREYEENRKKTGISKPTVLSSLDPKTSMHIPKCFVLDLMHLLSINIDELFLSLIRGTIKCESTDNKLSWDWCTLVGEVWENHGRLVAEATSLFPSFFHRPPRNPAQKINSGYKATEWFLYVFGLGPGLFRAVIPKQYWQNLCRLVRGVRILLQRSITGSQVREAHASLILFAEEYEQLYYRQRPDRIHFCRPCIHTITHAATEIIRVGPGTHTTQYPIERSINRFCRRIRQPSNPFVNLARGTVFEAQSSAAMSIYPFLDPKHGKPSIPESSIPVDKGFFLLSPRDRYATKITGPYAQVIIQSGFGIQRTRFGRLHLPDGHTARSLYSETRQSTKSVRVTRNVKVLLSV
jgi:hypothetical protein